MSPLDFGGPQLNANDISIEVGLPSDAFNKALDPLGFTQATNSEFEAITRAVKETFIIEANRAPTVLRERAPRTIRLFKVGKQARADGVTFWPMNQQLHIEQTGEIFEPKHFPLLEPVGIGLETDTHCTVTKELISTIAHECRHLLTRHGIHHFNIGPMEALNAGLDNAYYPHMKLQQNVHISNDRLWSTTGLNAPMDFGQVEYSHLAESALYLAATAAFDGISTEKLWEIWVILTDLAHATHRFPLQAEVRAAIENVLQEEAGTVLANPIFQPMSAGKHVFAFEGSEPGHPIGPHFYAFEAQQNQHYGFHQAEGGVRFDSRFVGTTDVEHMPYALTLLDEKGHSLAQGAGGIVKGGFGTSFQKECRNIERHLGPAGKELTDKIVSMNVQVGDLPPLPLRRPLS